MGTELKLDPKILVTILAVCIFGAQLVLKRFSGWAWRRTVMLSIIGFVVLLIGVTVVNLCFSSLHGLG